MGMKVYVVMEIGWEYNDENYYRPESEGGVPRTAYRDKDDAEEERCRLNIEMLKKPYAQKMITEWRSEKDYDIIVDYFEVVEVEFV